MFGLLGQRRERVRARGPAPAASGLTNGLVFFWPCDEASGNARADTEHGLAAAETGGAVGTTTGLMYPLAARLQNGVARKLVTPDSPLFYTGTNWTFAYWARAFTKPTFPGAFDVITITDGPGANEIAYTFYNDSDDVAIYGYQYNTGGQYLDWYDPSAGDLDWDALIAAGWQLYIATYDGVQLTYSRNAGTRQIVPNALANFAVADAGLTIGKKYSAANATRYPDMAYCAIAFASRAWSEADERAYFNSGLGLTRAEMD